MELNHMIGAKVVDIRIATKEEATALHGDWDTDTIEVMVFDNGAILSAGNEEGSAGFRLFKP